MNPATLPGSLLDARRVCRHAPEVCWTQDKFAGARPKFAEQVGSIATRQWCRSRDPRNNSLTSTSRTSMFAGMPSTQVRGIFNTPVVTTEIGALTCENTPRHYYSAPPATDSPQRQSELFFFTTKKFAAAIAKFAGPPVIFAGGG